MANQDLRFRRRVTTVGDQQPKKNLPLIMAVAASGLIIVPALVYTALHPAAVTSTVKRFAKAMPMQVKDIGVVSVVASRSTPTPQPSASPTASATPTSKTKQTPAQLAHAAHLKREHELALAVLHPKKVASTGQTSDSADGAASTVASTDTTASSDTGSTSGAGQNVPAPVSAPAASTRATTAPATPAAVAAVDQQQPSADATPVYEPELVVDARFAHQAQPDYPDVAKAQGVQGTAIVFATIGPNGNVLSTRIDQSTGNKLLDQAALEAAHQSTFEPPKINGKPATETYRLVYTFALGN